MSHDAERPLERGTDADTDAGADALASAGIPEGAAPHTTADDVAALAGVGGAMRDADEHPHLIGQVDAGEIYLPIMEEDAGEVPPGGADDARAPGFEPGAQL